MRMLSPCLFTNGSMLQWRATITPFQELLASNASILQGMEVCAQLPAVYGPGLRSIMAQYGARDFVTIQPYLQNLPRDYPIRVLASALAYRLWRADADLPAYEVGDNAVRIQRIGVPGL